MSYDLYLVDPNTKQTVEFESPHDIAGGTYQVGGTRDAWLNITYNYAEHFYRVMGEEGIRSLYGRTGLESISILENAINQLNAEDVDDDYWAPTEGNARKALEGLLQLAKAAPSAIWEGD